MIETVATLQPPIDFKRARRQMVDGQIRTFDVTDRALLTAMEEVPREVFVAPGQEALAYLDRSVTLRIDGEMRAMPAPMIIGRMMQALAVGEGSRVLVVGGSTGYGASVLSRLGCRTTLLESPAFAADAERRLGYLGATVDVVSGPLEAGWAASAPYDAILIEGGFIAMPAILPRSLVHEGRLVGIDVSNAAGRAVVVASPGGSRSGRLLFDAAAPVLPGFAAPKDFVF